MTTRQPLPSVADAGDTIGVLAASHLERTLRRMLRGPDVISEPGFHSMLTGIPHPLANITAFQDGVTLDAAQRALDAAMLCDAPTAVTYRPGGVDAAIEQLVTAHGFELQPPMPAMSVDIDALASTSLPDGCSFVRLLNDELAAAWGEALATGYPIPLEAARRFGPGCVELSSAPDAPMQFFGIVESERVVATSFVHLDDGVAGLYCVATVPDARRRGLGAHVTAEPLRRVHALGYRVGVLQSSEEGESVYRKLGFRTHAELCLGVRVPSPS